MLFMRCRKIGTAREATDDNIIWYRKDPTI
jgi:hypothetical protein